jgi:putative transposase
MDLRLVVASWPDNAPRGSVARFCAEHGVSRSWFHKVRARAREGDGTIASTLPRSRAPVRRPGATPAVIEDLALRIRKELAEDGWDHGPINVRERMLALGWPAPSRSTLAAIFVRRGAVVPAPQKRPRSSWKRFCFPRPNDCWQLDGTETALADGSKAVVLQVIDDHSRMILASLVAPTENAQAALAVVQIAIAAHGIPTHLLSDNGNAFNQTRRGRACLLQRHLHDLGVVTIAATPNHPQTCGKNERAHSTLKKWLHARPRPGTLSELQTLLRTFDHAYNNDRPHQALPRLATPAVAYRAIPKAPPPDLPENAPRPARRRTDVRTRPVNQRGYLTIDRYSICIGVAHAGHRFHVLVEPDRLVLFNAGGTHYRDITLEPGRTYYGNGQLPGGVRKPRLPSTMSSDT